ncbi:helix-turn-helix domain-containing protein [Streptomyces sp. NPDC087908]|uniref:PucR family transcriptional regulator n=1 Tax=unclassified Streptomyces TaxID=2593676 RepID=UPI0011CD3F90|nr:helix-turn-helix domain-containing protein [Streptomyces sp. adm13(2018)]TXS14919.1 PucR family transcriptional regulator [Streptomyces sp. adm13(2018)]
MPAITQSPDIGEPLEPLPREFAALMRPEIPGLIKEIGMEVQRTYPVYAHLFNGPHSDAIRQGVEQALAAFVERVADPATDSALRDELLRKFGRVEAYEGRDLDTLLGAYRLGARVALRRAKIIGRTYNLSPTLILAFADALFAYVDELEALSREGYVMVQTRAVSDVAALRRQLLHLVVAGPPLPRATIAELCRDASWELPEECTLVALRPPLAELVQAGLDRDVLADLTLPQPYLLIPGPLTADRLAMLGSALAGTSAVVGLTVPPAQAAHSIRWARRVLQLIDEGVVADAPLVHCEEHLTTLWLLTDTALVDQLARRELAPLDELSGTRRDRLIETLRVHVSTRAPAEQVGELLGVHAQTVRYRLRNLDGHFGDRLLDPDHRFALEAALRALHLGGRRRD